MKLLLSSNSTLAGEPYLDFCKNDINSFLNENGVKKVVFIPFAAIRFSYQDYEKMVTKGLGNSNLAIKSIHQYEDKKAAIVEADAIMVGGGNSFHLLHELYLYDLVETIKAKVSVGMPYVGWSAGSNMACPTIRTTNDMPIIFPPSFDTLNLIPFQINPHYIHGNPPGHNGETREERIQEFLELNQNDTVVGLREGTLLKIVNGDIELIGDKSARIFKHRQPFYELNTQDDFQFLIAGR